MGLRATLNHVGWEKGPAVIVIDPKQTFEHVLTSEKSQKKDPATLTVRPLTVRERHYIFRSATGGDDVEAFWKVLGAAVVGWKNISYPDGEPLPFDVQLLEHFNEEDVNDAFSYILALTTVTAAEAGK